MAQTLSHIRHSGKHLPHHHTSYSALAFLALLVGSLLVVATGTTQALTLDSNQALGVQATVPGPAPTNKAIITTPQPGQRFSLLPVQVSGTCDAGLIVEVFSNDVFVGSTQCAPDGHFSLQIDLFPGLNSLIARLYDSLGQSGPNSTAVNVTYDQAANLGAVIATSDQLVLHTDSAVVRGVVPGGTITWPMEVGGGGAPYAISIDWGDGSVDPISQQAAGKFDAKHTYLEPGTHKVVVKAVDATGQQAYLELVAIVNGTPAAVSTSPTPHITGNLLLAWPLYVVLLVLILSFWLGERYEKHLLAPRLVT